MAAALATYRGPLSARFREVSFGIGTLLGMRGAGTNPRWLVHALVRIHWRQRERGGPVSNLRLGIRRERFARGDQFHRLCRLAPDLAVHVNIVAA